jgi:hypothetical protein
MATAKNTAVAVVEEVKNLPATELGGYDLEDFAGAGLENVSTKDMAIPFLSILQALSPQLDENNGKYVEGAKQGGIINTALGRVYGRDEGIYVVPCGFQSRLVEWTPRESGGGFVAEHPTDSDLLQRTRKNEKGQDALPNGNLLVLTATHYVLLVDPDTGAATQAVIPMSSTQLKKSRAWNSMMASIKVQGKNGMFTPPSFSQLYHLTTGPEKNAKGSWYSWQIENKGLVSVDVFRQACDFAESVKAGAVKIAREEIMGADEHDPLTGECAF